MFWCNFRPFDVPIRDVDSQYPLALPNDRVHDPPIIVLLIIYSDCHISPNGRVGGYVLFEHQAMSVLLRQFSLPPLPNGRVFECPMILHSGNYVSPKFGGFWAIKRGIIIFED